MGLETEICVLGGGPAGSVIARCLAQLGHRTIMIERNPLGQRQRVEFIPAFDHLHPAFTGIIRCDCFGDDLVRRACACALEIRYNPREVVRARDTPCRAPVIRSAHARGCGFCRSRYSRPCQSEDTRPQTFRRLVHSGNRRKWSDARHCGVFDRRARQAGQSVSSPWATYRLFVGKLACSRFCLHRDQNRGRP